MHKGNALLICSPAAPLPPSHAVVRTFSRRVRSGRRDGATARAYSSGLVLRHRTRDRCHSAKSSRSTTAVTDGLTHRHTAPNRRRTEGDGTDRTGPERPYGAGHSGRPGESHTRCTGARSITVPDPPGGRRPHPEPPPGAEPERVPVPLPGSHPERPHGGGVRGFETGTPRPRRPPHTGDRETPRHSRTRPPVRARPHHPGAGHAPAAPHPCKSHSATGPRDARPRPRTTSAGLLTRPPERHQLPDHSEDFTARTGGNAPSEGWPRGALPALSRPPPHRPHGSSAPRTGGCAKNGRRGGRRAVRGLRAASARGVEPGLPPGFHGRPGRSGTALGPPVPEGVRRGSGRLAPPAGPGSAFGPPGPDRRPRGMRRRCPPAH